MRLLGIFIQSPAQLLDRTIQAALKVYEHIVRPESLPQFFPSDKYAGAFEEIQKYFERLA